MRGKCGPSQGRAYQLVFQDQEFSLEITHTSDITWTHWVIFRTTYAYTNEFIYSLNNSKKKGHEQVQGRDIWEDVKG